MKTRNSALPLLICSFALSLSSPKSHGAELQPKPGDLSVPLSRKLIKKDAPEGADPSVGDIAYYAPWGNLALYYKDFSYSKGLIKLGKVDSGLEVISASGPKPVKATIELMH